MEPTPASYLIESGMVLMVLVAFGATLVYAARRAGIGRAVGSIEMLARLPLEARRSVYVVRVLDQVLILGASEAGLTKLGELPPSRAAELRGTPPAEGFAAVLARALGRPSLDNADVRRREGEPPSAGGEP